MSPKSIAHALYLSMIGRAKTTGAMTVEEFRAHVDAKGVVEVARICGCTVQTAEGYCSGRHGVPAPAAARLNGVAYAPEPEMTRDELQEILARYGNKSAVARALGITSAALYPWTRGEARVPARIAIALRALTPEAVDAWRFNPGKRRHQTNMF